MKQVAKSKWVRRAFAFLMAALIALTMFPSAVFAGEENGVPAQGQGLEQPAQTESDLLVQTGETPAPGVADSPDIVEAPADEDPVVTPPEDESALAPDVELLLATPDTGTITVYLDLEGYNIGQGYYIAPVKVEVPAGSTAAIATKAMFDMPEIKAKDITAVGIESNYIGRVTNIDKYNPKAGVGILEIPDYITANSSSHLTLAGAKQTGNNAWPHLDAGTSYSGESGWMYTVNHVMANVGLGDYTLHDGDVIRWQFTVAGYGADIGGPPNSSGSSDDWGEDPYYAHADKTALIRALFTDGATTEAIDDALDIIINPTATATEVSAALAALTGEEPPEPPAPSVDKTALESVIAQVEELVAVNYTTESWAILQAKLVVATALASDPVATQEQIDAATATLTAAIAALKKAPPADGWMTIDAPNGNLFAKVQEKLANDFGQSAGAYDYTVVKKLKITGAVTAADFTNVLGKTAINNTTGVYTAKSELFDLEELDLAGITGITAFPSSAMRYLRNLTTIRLPENIKTGSAMLLGTDKLRTVVFGNGPFTAGVADLTGYKQTAFTDDSFNGSGIKKVVYPANIPVPTNMFYVATLLEEVDFIGNVPSIAGGAFAHINDQGYTTDAERVRRGFPNGTYNANQPVLTLVFRGGTAPTISTTTFNYFGPYSGGVTKPVAYVSDKTSGGYQLAAFTDKFSKVLQIAPPAPPVGKAALDALIASNDGLSQGSYTVASWTGFASALATAKSVAANDAATQAQVDDAAQALLLAAEGLIKKNFELQIDPNDYLNNISLSAYYREMTQSDTYTLQARRLPEIIDNAINNNVVLPDFHFEVVKGNSVDVSSSGVITPKSLGTSVIYVTYDEKIAYGTTYGKISKVNTAVAIINVTDGAVGPKIETNIAHSPYDTIYTTGETGSISFTATADSGATVTVKADGVLLAAKDGVYTAATKLGSTIIEVAASKDGATSRAFSIIKTKQVKINVANKTRPGEPLAKGDTARINFERLVMPVYKLATIYNPQFPPNGTVVQYNNAQLGLLSSKNDKQYELGAGNVIDIVLSQSGEYTFTNGNIYEKWWGESLYSDMVFKSRPPNMDANTLEGHFSKLPDFTVTVLEEPAPANSDKTALNALIAECKAIAIGEYTPSSYAAFQTAISAAEAVAVDDDALQYVVDQAVEALTAAKDALLLKSSDKEGAVVIGDSDLVRNQYETFYYTEAEVFYYNGNPATFVSGTQFEANGVRYNLKNKKISYTIVTTDNSATINFTGLDVPISQVSGKWSSLSGNGSERKIAYDTNIAGKEKVRSDGYGYALPLTLSGLAPGSYSLTNGSLWEKANAYSPGLDLGHGNVTEGYFGRLPAITFTIAAPEPSVDKTALNEAIAAAEALTATDYTAASWTELQTVLTEAKLVSANTKTTQEQVDAAREALRAKIDALAYNITFIKVTKGATIGVFKKGVHYTAFTSYLLTKDESKSDAQYDVYKVTLHTGALHLEAYIPGVTAKSAKFINYNATNLNKGDTIMMDLTPLEDWIPATANYYAADLYTNLGDSGTLDLGVDESFVLDTFRVWQAVDSTTNNYFIEPYFNFELIGSSAKIERIGAPGREQLKITAVKPGVSVIKITYDPIERTLANGTVDKFNASAPGNTGVVIVNVGEAGTFDTGITARNDFDTYYFDKAVGSRSFTFTPADGTTVRVHDPLNISSWESGWTSYTASSEGSFTVTFKEGRNIIELTNGGAKSYYVVKANGVDVTVENTTDPGQPFEQGDIAKITVKGMEEPIEKMGGIYNPGFGAANFPYMRYTNGSANFDSNKGGQYTTLTDTFTVNYTLSDISKNVLTGKLYCGVIFGGGMGIGSHRAIGPGGTGASIGGGQTGTGDALWFGALPEIVLPVAQSTPSIDKTALNAAIAQAEALDAEAYTAETWAVLAEALALAKTVAADDAATQTAVDAAKPALDDAIAALAAKPATVTVYVDFEGYNLGQGYYVAPTKLTVPVGTTAGQASVQVLEQNNISANYTGGYLSKLFGVDKGTVVLPPYLSEVILKPKTGNDLGEFNYSDSSGWLYTVNHVTLQMSAWSHVLQEGDVVRWQFTLASLGADLGLSSGFGAGALYTHQDKSKLIRALLSDDAVESGKEQALAVVINPLATAAEVNAAWLAVRPLNTTKSSDASVSLVKVSGVLALAGSNNSYSAQLPTGSNLANAQVAVTTTDLNAKVSTPATANGGATWTFAVTAEDGITIESYTVSLSVTTPSNILGLLVTDGAGNPAPERGTLTTDGVYNNGYVLNAAPASPDYVVTAIEYSLNGTTWTNYYPGGRAGYASATMSSYAGIQASTQVYFRARFIKVGYADGIPEGAGSVTMMQNPTNAMALRLTATSRVIVEDGSYAYVLKRWQATTVANPTEADWTITAGTTTPLSYTPGSTTNAVPTITKDILIRPQFVKVELTSADAARGTATLTDGGNLGQVKLNVQPAEGYAFAKWTVSTQKADGDWNAPANNTTNPGSGYTPGSTYTDEKLVAYFCSVEVTSENEDKGTVSKTLNPTTARYSLTATPKEGYVFSKWESYSGSAWVQASTAATNYQPNPNEDAKYRAVFSGVTVSVAPDSDGKGTVAVTGNASTATISATPTAEGYYFGYWEVSTNGGDTWIVAKSGSNNLKATASVTATVDTAYRAHFYPVTVDNTGAGGSAALGTDGTQVTLTATPDAGYYLLRFEYKLEGSQDWIAATETGTIASSTNAVTITPTVSEARTYRAVFAQMQTLTVKTNEAARAMLDVRALTLLPAWGSSHNVFTMQYTTSDMKSHAQDDGTWTYADFTAQALVTDMPFDLQIRVPQKQSASSTGATCFYEDRYDLVGFKVNGVTIGSAELFKIEQTADATGQLESGLYWYYGYNKTNNCYILYFSNSVISWAGAGSPNQHNNKSSISDFSGNIVIEPLFAEKALTGGQKADLAEREANLNAVKAAYAKFLAVDPWQVARATANTKDDVTAWMGPAIKALGISDDVTVTVTLSNSFTAATSTADGSFYYNVSFACGTGTNKVTIYSGEYSSAYAKGFILKSADKTVLAAAITTAEALDEADYTAESWAVLAEALALAKTVADDGAATQAAVDTAVTALNEAVGALALVPPRSDYVPVLTATLAQLFLTTTPGVGSTGGEWATFALARGGVMTDAYKAAYLSALDTALGSNAYGTASKTDRERITLALSALGIDASAYGAGKVDLTATYKTYAPGDMANAKIYGLLALDAKPYTGTQTAYVNGLLAAQVTSGASAGGWALTGSAADIDVTAMALQALAPYYHDGDETLDAAVDAALAWLKSVQKVSGGFVSSFGSSEDVSTESTAQVVVALASLKIDPTGADWSKAKGNPLTALLSNYNSTGWFGKNDNSTRDQMSTEQAAYALVAYDRFVNGANALYDMRDVFGGTEPPEPPEPVSATVSVTVQTDDTGFAFIKEALTVSSDLSEQYGYVDAFDGGKVSALDVLVATHIAMYGAAAFKDKLTAGSGSVTKAFGKSGYITFAVNNELPGENGTLFAIPDTAVANGDDVRWFYMRGSYLDDYMAWFDEGRTLEAQAGVDFDLTLNGYGLMWPMVGMDADVFPIENALVTILKANDEGGYLSAAIDDPVGYTDANGKITLSFDEAGTYYITAIDDGDTETEDDYDFPIVYPLIKVTVTDDGGVTPPEPPNPDMIKVTVSVEKFTVPMVRGGGGYVVAPTLLTVPKDSTAAFVLDKLLKDNGIAYINAGSIASGFYLSGLKDAAYTEPDTSDQKDGYLGEKDEGVLSGWKYSVGNAFPGSGASDFVLQDGAVMRWQYTATGDFTGIEDISAPAQPANKDSLTAKVAEIGALADADKAAWLAVGNNQKNYDDAQGVLKNLGSSQQAVDDALAALNGGGGGSEPGEPDEITVTMSYQADDTGFVIARREFTVASDLSEQYGYPDAFGGEKVSALDAVVAAHIAVFGDDKEIINQKMGLDNYGSGDFIANFMGDGAGNMRYYVNGDEPSDGTSKCELGDGDIVELFAVRDTSGWSDIYGYFAKEDVHIEQLGAVARQSFALKLMGSAWEGVSPVSGAKIVTVTVNADGTASFGAALAVTDANGVASLTFDAAGTYILSAIRGDAAQTPLMSPWLVVTVTDGSGQPPTPVNKTGLAAAIQIAEALVKADYTAESWSVLTKSVATAKIVLANEGATQTQVDDATVAIVAAIDGLTLKPDGPVTPDPDDGGKAPLPGKGEVKSILEKVAAYQLDAVAGAGYESEWVILGLARGGYLTSDVREDYLARLEKYLKEQGGTFDKATDYERVILALSALGVDARSFAGYDLTSKLTDLAYVKRQGVNGVIYALLALDSGDYGTTETRTALIQELRTRQLVGGGWNLAGTAADPDITGMALQALARYYNSGDSGLDAAVDLALSKLSELQNKETGGFGSSLGGTFTLSVESCAQVLVALNALGIPVNDARFAKNGKTVYDALTSYYKDTAVGKGGFEHVKGGGVNGMATEQGLYALVSLYRALSGKTGLYDLSDVSVGGGAPAPMPGDKTALRAAVSAVEALKQGDYTAESWAALQAALASAKAVLADANASQARINVEVKDLQAAVRGLVRKTDGGGNGGGDSGKTTVVNKSLLESAIAQARGLAESAYTAATWSRVVSALKTAEDVLASGSATQTDVDNARSTLLSAINVLAVKIVAEEADTLAMTAKATSGATAQTPVVSKSVLNTAIDSAKTLIEKDYTPETWKALATALEQAEKVAADKNAKQADVDAAKNALLSAIGGLEVAVSDKAAGDGQADAADTIADDAAPLASGTDTLGVAAQSGADGTGGGLTTRTLIGLIALIVAAFIAGLLLERFGVFRKLYQKLTGKGRPGADDRAA